MIEINVKAKGADPWDTPPLTWEQLVEKKQQGCLIAYWVYDNDQGLWKLYDNMNPRDEAKQDLLAKYFNTPNKWQIRAHKTSKVVLVQPISFIHDPWMDAGKRTYIHHVMAQNASHLKERIASMKALRPDMKLLTPIPTWYIIPLTEGAPLVLS